MKERGPEDYYRTSSVFIIRSRIVKFKVLTKYGGRRPRKNKLIKPRHLTQKHKFSSLENRIFKSASLFPKKSKRSAPVYHFKDYAIPKLQSVYLANFHSTKEYLGSFPEEEKPKPKPQEEPVEIAKPKDISYKFEKETYQNSA